MAKKNRPQQFFQRMEHLIGSSDAYLLLDAITKFAPKSVRYHSRQCSVKELKGLPVPWCSPYGRYWQEDFLPSRAIEYAAGKYYIQEASAMLAISVASQVIDFSDKIVLDLTAAPGGKTTQVAEYIQKGYLVANEVINKRVNSLIWNVNRHRLNNVIVTSMETELFTQMLPGFFDVVIVDAPCSGEGLFQKRKHFLENWSEKNVRFCASRQKAILADAQKMLKPGGYLVYSTCTFSQEENEDQVEFLINHGFSPVPLSNEIPVSPAISVNEDILICSRRIFPHREKGAGAFVSIVRKDTDSFLSFQGEYHEGNQELVLKKSRLLPVIQPRDRDGYYFEKSGMISYFSYPRIPLQLFEKNLQLGAPLIDKRKSSTLMYGSVQLASPDAMIEVDLNQTMDFLKGEDLLLGKTNGFYFIQYKEMVLGPVKIINGKAINQLPVPLRIPK